MNDFTKKIEIKNIHYPKVGAEIIVFLFEKSKEIYTHEILSLIHGKIRGNYGDAKIATFLTLNQLVSQGLVETVDYNPGIEGYDSSLNPKYRITEKGRNFVKEEKQKAEETKKIIERNKKR